MHQKSYIEFLVNKFLTPEEKASRRRVKSPMVSLMKPLEPDCDLAKVPYRSIVGALLYIAVCTRPDIAFAVCHLSRFLSRYGQEHYDAAKRVLRYLKETADHGIRIRPGSDEILRIYADADLGNDFSNKSVTGYVIMLGSTPISWGSKMQPTIAQSTLEAEYGALNQATKEGLFVRHIIEDTMTHALRLNEDIVTKYTKALVPLEVYCDNARLVDSIKSGSIIGARSVRHLRLKAGWLRERLATTDVHFEHIAGVDNPADMFTKPLGETALIKNMKIMRVLWTERY